VYTVFQGIEGGAGGGGVEVEGRERVEPVRPQYTHPISKRVRCHNANLRVLSSKGLGLIEDDLTFVFLQGNNSMFYVCINTVRYRYSSIVKKSQKRMTI